jgi:IrrE N-terminal-like domain
MITWADANSRAAAMASELQADLKIPLDRPVDVFGAIENLGLVLAFAPLGRTSGLYLPRTYPHAAGILLHEGHPRTRQRYTAGHELGHHAFHHAAGPDDDLESALLRGDVEKWPDHEKEAEAFGAWFLMPRRLIRAGLAALGIGAITGPYDVYALSLWLGTSYTATARQLSATRIVPYAVADQWAHIPPKTLKVGLAGEFVPDDLHNDVWWLDGRHSHEPIEARPGDRVVLMLDETPSTGYSWSVEALPTQIRVLADSYQDEWEPQTAADLGAINDQFDGGSHPRCFVLEIDPNATDEGVLEVALAKNRTWSANSQIDEFNLTIAVHPRLHGVQLPEQELALAR